MALVDIKDLSFSYPNEISRGGASPKALDGISLSIARGEFITLMGATGSGKSTLLRLLKPELRQNGETQGEIVYSLSTPEGEQKVSLDVENIHPRVVGYVAQNPEEQIVTDKVWHELAFTLENLGAKQQDIARRVAETAAYFGIASWMERDTATLSGGEKQLLNLAAVMTADPELLLLDEPTAQLDPIAATRLIETVYRLNRETGVTVVMCEHRCEELFGIADRVVILDHGRVRFDDTPRNVARQIGADRTFEAFLPTAARLYQYVTRSAQTKNTIPQPPHGDSALTQREADSAGKVEIPLTVREGQRFVETLKVIERKNIDITETKAEEALTLKGVCFRYERRGADILRDLDLSVKTGEVFALLGANGAGKSTAAAVAAGLRKPYCGTVKLFGKPLKDYKNGALYQGNLSLLPQDAESVFIRETVREELKGCEEVVEEFPFDLRPLYDRHPYDISGGERQLVALSKALSSKPRFLIMDEPSKGLDAKMKELLREVIGRLKENGVTILLITHDVEFAALCADRCALFAQGRVAALDSTERFMSDNRFYTTAASRITRRFVDGAYTVELAAERFSYDGGTA